MHVVNGTPLDSAESSRIDAYWRAASYLSVGQIYLMGNPLLREPLTPQQVKPRLLGHWGTTPGLNLLYAHLSRIIAARGQELIYVTGPGHGGPGIVANAWLEGTYTEVYPPSRGTRPGWPGCSPSSPSGGIPSHVATQTPGSIHEGGELGYALSHAYGAALDNPDLVAASADGRHPRRAPRPHPPHGRGPAGGPRLDLAHEVAALRKEPPCPSQFPPT